MISTVKDDADKVISYMEWRQVGQSGFDKLHGEYIYIAEFWIHDDYSRQYNIFRELMEDIFLKARLAKWVYFKRRKYMGRMSKTYSKEQIMKLVKRGMVII